MPSKTKELAIHTVIFLSLTICYFIAEYQILGPERIMEIREEYSVERTILLIALGVAQSKMIRSVMGSIKRRREGAQS